MFNRWVFMLHWKAVWMLFEDWLEYKTSSNCSLECQLSDSLLRYGSSSPTVILLWIAHRFLVSPSPHTIAMGLKRAVSIPEVSSASLVFQKKLPVSQGPTK